MSKIMRDIKANLVKLGKSSKDLSINSQIAYDRLIKGLNGFISFTYEEEAQIRLQIAAWQKKENS